jgi:hypothetical protein
MHVCVERFFSSDGHCLVDPFPRVLHFLLYDLYVDCILIVIWKTDPVDVTDVLKRWQDIILLFASSERLLGSR